MIIETTQKYYTGDFWLLQAFNNYTSPSGASIIKVKFDYYGTPYVGLTIATDPTWNMQLPVTNPLTQETKPLIEWLRETTIFLEVEQ